MNANSIVTLTLGDQAENHAGMEKLGELVNEGEGFNLLDLEAIKLKLESIGIVCELVPLELYEEIDKIDNSIAPPEDAYILIIRDGVNKLLENCKEYNREERYCFGDGHFEFRRDHLETSPLENMFEEHKCLNLDKKAWMKGKVVNKHARWNLCFDTESREPDYENKKGRIVSYDEIEITKKLLNMIPEYFGSKATNLKGEGNYYYDRTSCGIGFHGDSERRKVIGIRLGLGESIPLHYQWFRESIPVGERIILPLNGGDMYVMSEKAVGTDWKKKKIYTLRHATGCEKYTSI